MSREPWDVIGETQPYYGVCTDEQFRGQSLSPETAERFYTSGANYIYAIRALFERHFGTPPGGAALDIGCGVGRLTLAMAPHCSSVVGYDVAPSMLERAREAAAQAPHGDRARFVDVLPDESFDWLMSFIVFQHIPPADGMALLDQVLARLAPGGFVSLHFTIWREAIHVRQGGVAGWFSNRLLRRLTSKAMRGEAASDTLIRMYDYDLAEITKRIVDSGCPEMVMRHTDHGGHHGVEILARRTA